MGTTHPKLRTALLGTMFLAALATNQAVAGPISVSTDDQRTLVAINDSYGPRLAAETSAFSSSAPNLPRTFQAELEGTVAATTLNWSDTTTLANFDFGIASTVAHGFGKSATSAGTLNFTADIDSTYSLSGFYDSIVRGQNLFLSVALLDLTLSSQLFNQDSRLSSGFLTPGDSVSLSVGGPNSAPTYHHNMFGSLSGDLIAGNSYSFYYQFTQESPGRCLTVDCVDIATPELASTLGNLNLTIAAKSVPEPGNGVLLLLGLLGLASKRSRLRDRAAS